MPPKKVPSPPSNIIWVAVLLVVIAIFGVGIMMMVMQMTKRQMDDNTAAATNKVCIPLEKYNVLVQQQQSQNLPVYPTQPAVTIASQIKQRDTQVLSDPLYPPLNRPDAVTSVLTEEKIQKRDLYVPTSDNRDTFRLVGYVINEDTENRDQGGNSWKLFAREKNRNQGEFYMIPVNNNYDLKIPITNEMMKGERLRDVYTIPNELTFQSPLLLSSPYKFMELPKTDFTSSMYH